MCAAAIGGTLSLLGTQTDLGAPIHVPEVAHEVGFDIHAWANRGVPVARGHFLSPRPCYCVSPRRVCVSRKSNRSFSCEGLP